VRLPVNVFYSTLALVLLMSIPHCLQWNNMSIPNGQVQSCVTKGTTVTVSQRGISVLNH